MPKLWIIVNQRGEAVGKTTNGHLTIKNNFYLVPRDVYVKSHIVNLTEFKG